MYVDDLLARDKLPKQFEDIIPEQVAQLAHHVYQDWDKALYPDVQKEIAIKLLKLRVEFHENTSATDSPAKD